MTWQIKPGPVGTHPLSRPGSLRRAARLQQAARLPGTAAKIRLADRRAGQDQRADGARGRPRPVPAVSRKGPDRPHAGRQQPPADLRQPAARAGIQQLYRHPAGAGECAVVHREPRTADRGIPHPQSGGGMGSPGASPAGKGHQRDRSQSQRAGRQHAADADRKISPLARGPHRQHGRKTAADGDRQPARLPERPQHPGHAARDRDRLSQHRAAGGGTALRRGQRHRRRPVGLVRPRLRRGQQDPGEETGRERRRLRQRAEACAVADRGGTPSLVLPRRQPQGARRADRRPHRSAGQHPADFARTGRPGQAGQAAHHQPARRPAAAAFRRAEGHQRAAHPRRPAARRIAPVRPRPARPAGRHQHQPAGAKDRQRLSAKPGQTGSGWLHPASSVIACCNRKTRSAA